MTSPSRCRRSAGCCSWDDLVDDGVAVVWVRDGPVLEPRLYEFSDRVVALPDDRAEGLVVLTNLDTGDARGALRADAIARDRRGSIASGDVLGHPPARPTEALDQTPDLASADSCGGLPVRRARDRGSCVVRSGELATGRSFDEASGVQYNSRPGALTRCGGFGRFCPLTRRRAAPGHENGLSRTRRGRWTRFTGAPGPHPAPLSSMSTVASIAQCAAPVRGGWTRRGRLLGVRRSQRGSRTRVRCASSCRASASRRLGYRRRDRSPVPHGADGPASHVDRGAVGAVGRPGRRRPPNLHLPIAHRAGASPLICTSETHSPPRVGVPSTSTHVYAELRPLIPKPLAVHPTALALPVAGSAANALTLAASASDGTNPCPWPTRTNRRRMFSKAVLLIGATCRFVDGDRRALTPPNRPGPCATVFKPRVVRAGDPRGSGMAAGRAELSMLGRELHRRLGGRERR